MNHPLPDMMGLTIQKIKEMVDVNTVIGDAIQTPEGVTVIPVSKVKIGLAGGGSDFAPKNYPANKANAFGGGSGAGVDITPVAFLVIKGESVRVLPVAAPASGSVERLVEMLPDLIDQVTELVKKKRSEEASISDLAEHL